MPAGRPMKTVEMSSQRRSGVRGFEVFSRTCAGIVGGVSLAVFAGWAFDLPALRSIHPALVSMKVNSALGFALAAFSLAVLSLRRHRPHGLLLARVAAAGVLLLGGATLLEHATGWNPGLDQMFFPESPDAATTPHPGRMTVPTSALFVAGGCALLCLSSTRWRRAGHGLGVALHLYGILASSVCFYDWRMPDTFGSFASMSIQSAFLFLVLGAAIATEGGPMLRLSRLEPHLGSLSLLLALCLLGLGVGTLHGNADRLVTVNRAILASPGLQDSLSPPARRALAREQAAVESDTVRAQVALAFGAASAFLLIVLGFVLMRREIGTRRRIEADHDRLFNLSLDMLAVAGFDGYFKDINPSWERTLGWSRHELMSVPYLKYVHPDDVEETVRAAQGLSRGQPAVRFVNRYRCKDESYRWICWNSFPVPGEQLVFAVARDVTADRRSGEEILRLNRELEQRVAERTAELAAANTNLQTALAEVREAMDRDTAARRRAEQEMRLNESRLESQLRLHQMVREDLGTIAHFAMEEAVRLTGSTLGYVAFMSPDETVLPR